jgi:hypothetical protein
MDRYIRFITTDSACLAEVLLAYVLFVSLFGGATTVCLPCQFVFPLFTRII